MSTEKERESHVYMVKLAEQAECYDEMVESMKKVAKLDVKLTVEERNLLFVGYKNVVGARRARQKVEEKLSKTCNDTLMIIDEHLIPSSIK
ncbi:hypothetical protein L7F22_041151 [Adiantum nelumboides]|nr:hypothetical protein [Adiantum nelumboides]